MRFVFANLAGRGDVVARRVEVVTDGCRIDKGRVMVGFVRPIVAIVGEFAGGVWETQANLYAVGCDQGAFDMTGDGIFVGVGESGDIDGNSFERKVAADLTGPEEQLLVDVLDVVEGGEGVIAFRHFEANVTELEAMGVDAEVFDGRIF